MMSSKSLVVWGVSRIRGGGTSVPRHDYYRRSVAGRDASLSASRPQEPRTLERDDRRGFCRFGDVIDRAGQLALENAPGIRVNAVAPGAVDTAFLRGGTGRSHQDAPARLNPQSYGQFVPLGRIAQPQDVVGPILFLLSPAAAYMTGQTLYVNGGTFMV